MPQRPQFVRPNLYHPSTFMLTVIAVSFVLVIALISGVVFSVRAVSSERLLKFENTPTPSDSAQPSTHLPAVSRTPISQTNITQEAQTMSESTPTNQSSSNSTVTINGQTTTLNGSGTIDKSYTSADGQAKVNIKIKHTDSVHE